MKNIKITSLVMMLIFCVSCSKNHPPSIQDINIPVNQVQAGSTITITAIAVDQDGDSLTYVWSADFGTVPTGSQSAQIEYTAPNSPGAGRDKISVTVSDGKDIDTSEKEIALIPLNTTNVADTATNDGGTDATTNDGADTATNDGVDATTKVTVVPDNPVPPTDEPTLPADTPIPPTDEPTLPTHTPTSIATATEPPTFTPTPLPFTQVTANQYSNVRSGPGTAYDNIGTATDGETFEVLGTLEDNSWWLINYNDQEGWIHNSLVTLEGSIESLDIVTPPPPPATNNTLWVDNFDDCNKFNLLGGESGSAYEPGQGFMVESFPSEEGRGCVARLDYDITRWSAFFMKLRHSDLSPYNQISFWVKADSEGNPGQIKVELKRVCTEIAENKTECREIEIAFIPVSTSWEQKFINLANFQETGWPGFGPITDWSDIEELVFTVESNGSQKQGVFYLDDIAFLP